VAFTPVAQSAQNPAQYDPPGMTKYIFSRKHTHGLTKSADPDDIDDTFTGGGTSNNTRNTIYTFLRCHHVDLNSPNYDFTCQYITTLMGHSVTITFKSH
jgi:hypothetical protein